MVASPASRSTTTAVNTCSSPEAEVVRLSPASRHTPVTNGNPGQLPQDHDSGPAMGVSTAGSQARGHRHLNLDRLRAHGC
jgi:hypothetical protein